jgi:hypothetical protein
MKKFLEFMNKNIKEFFQKIKEFIKNNITDILYITAIIVLFVTMSVLSKGYNKLKTEEVDQLC